MGTLVLSYMISVILSDQSHNTQRANAQCRISQLARFNHGSKCKTIWTKTEVLLPPNQLHKLFNVKRAMDGTTSMIPFLNRITIFKHYLDINCKKRKKKKHHLNDRWCCASVLWMGFYWIKLLQSWQKLTKIPCGQCLVHFFFFFFQI